MPGVVQQAIQPAVALAAAHRRAGRSRARGHSPDRAARCRPRRAACACDLRVHRFELADRAADQHHLAPCAAQASATARPMPSPAPVMAITRPCELTRRVALVARIDADQACCSSNSSGSAEAPGGGPARARRAPGHPAGHDGRREARRASRRALRVRAAVRPTPAAPRSAGAARASASSEASAARAAAGARQRGRALAPRPLRELLPGSTPRAVSSSSGRRTRPAAHRIGPTAVPVRAVRSPSARSSRLRAVAARCGRQGTNRPRSSARSRRRARAASRRSRPQDPRSRHPRSRAAPRAAARGAEEHLLQRARQRVLGFAVREALRHSSRHQSRRTWATSCSRPGARLRAISRLDAEQCLEPGRCGAGVEPGECSGGPRSGLADMPGDCEAAARQRRRPARRSHRGADGLRTSGFDRFGRGERRVGGHAQLGKRRA